MAPAAASAGEELAVVAAAAVDLETVEEIVADTAIGTVEIADQAAVASRVVVALEVVVLAGVAPAEAVAARNGKVIGSARIVATRTLPGETSAIAASRPNPREPEAVPAAEGAVSEVVEVVAEDLGADAEVTGVAAEEALAVEEAVAAPCGEVIETATSARDHTRKRVRLYFTLQTLILS